MSTKEQEEAEEAAEEEERAAEVVATTHKRTYKKTHTSNTPKINHAIFDCDSTEQSALFEISKNNIVSCIRRAG